MTGDFPGVNPPDVSNFPVPSTISLARRVADSRGIPVSCTAASMNFWTKKQRKAGPQLDKSDVMRVYSSDILNGSLIGLSRSSSNVRSFFVMRFPNMHKEAPLHS